MMVRARQQSLLRRQGLFSSNGTCGQTNLSSRIRNVHHVRFFSSLYDSDAEVASGSVVFVEDDIQQYTLPHNILQNLESSVKAVNPSMVVPSVQGYLYSSGVLPDERILQALIADVQNRRAQLHTHARDMNIAQDPLFVDAVTKLWHHVGQQPDFTVAMSEFDEFCMQLGQPPISYPGFASISKPREQIDVSILNLSNTLLSQHNATLTGLLAQVMVMLRDPTRACYFALYHQKQDQNWDFAALLEVMEYLSVAGYPQASAYLARDVLGRGANASIVTTIRLLKASAKVGFVEGMLTATGMFANILSWKSHHIDHVSEFVVLLLQNRALLQTTIINILALTQYTPFSIHEIITQPKFQSRISQNDAKDLLSVLQLPTRPPPYLLAGLLSLCKRADNLDVAIFLFNSRMSIEELWLYAPSLCRNQVQRDVLTLPKPVFTEMVEDGAVVSGQIALQNLVYQMRSQDSIFQLHTPLPPITGTDRNCVELGEDFLQRDDVEILPFTSNFEANLLEFPAYPQEDVFTATELVDPLLSGTFATQQSQQIPAWSSLMYSWLTMDSDAKHTNLIRQFKKEHAGIARWESESVDVMVQILLAHDKPKTAFVFLESYLHSTVVNNRVIPIVDVSPDDVDLKDLADIQKARKVPCFVGYSHVPSNQPPASPLHELVGQTQHTLMRQPVYWNTKLYAQNKKLRENISGDTQIHGNHVKPSDSSYLGVPLAGSDMMTPIGGVDSLVLHALTKETALLDTDPAKLTYLPLVSSETVETKAGQTDVFAIKSYLHGMAALAVEIATGNPTLAWELSLYTQHGVSGVTLSTHAPVTCLPTHRKGNMYPSQVMHTLDGKQCPRVNSYQEGVHTLPGALVTHSPYLYALDAVAYRNWSNNRWWLQPSQKQSSPLSIIQFNTDFHIIGAFSPLHSKCFMDADGLINSTMSTLSSLPMMAGQLNRYAISVTKGMTKTYMSKYIQYLSTPLIGHVSTSLVDSPDGNLLSSSLTVAGKTILYAMVSPHWTSLVHSNFKYQQVLRRDIAASKHDAISIDSIGLLPCTLKKSHLPIHKKTQQTHVFPSYMNVAALYTPVNSVTPASIQASGQILPNFPLVPDHVVDVPFVSPVLKYIAYEEEGVNVEFLANNLKVVVHNLLKQQEYAHAVNLILTTQQQDSFQYPVLSELHKDVDYYKHVEDLYTHFVMLKNHSVALSSYFLAALYKDVGVVREWSWVQTMFGHMQQVQSLWSAYYLHQPNTLQLKAQYSTLQNNVSSDYVQEQGQISLHAKAVFPMHPFQSNVQISEADQVPSVTIRELKQQLQEGGEGKAKEQLTQLPRVLGMALGTVNMGWLSRGFLSCVFNNVLVKRHFLQVYKEDQELCFYQIFRDLGAVQPMDAFEAMDGASDASATAIGMRLQEVSLFELLASQVPKGQLPPAFPWTEFHIDMLTAEQQVKLQSEIIVYDEGVARRFGIEMFSQVHWIGDFHSQTATHGLGQPLTQVATLFHEDPLLKVCLHLRLGLETYQEMGKPDLGIRFFLRSFEHKVWSAALEQQYVTLGANKTAQLVKTHPLFTLAQYYLAGLHAKYPALAFSFYRMCVNHGLFAPFLSEHTDSQEKHLVTDSISVVLSRKLHSSGEGTKKPENVKEVESTDTLASHVIQAVIASSSGSLKDQIHLRQLAQTASGVPLLMQSPYGKRLDTVKNTQVYVDEALRKVTSGDFSDFGPYYHPFPNLHSPYVNSVARADHYIDRGVYFINLEDLTPAGKQQLGPVWMRLLTQNRDVQTAYDLPSLPTRQVSIVEQKEKYPDTTLICSSMDINLHMSEDTTNTKTMALADLQYTGQDRDVQSAKSGFCFGLSYLPFSNLRRACNLDGYWTLTSLYTAKYIQEYKLSRFLELPAGILHSIRAVEAELALFQLQKEETPEMVNGEIIDASNISKLGKWTNERAVFGSFQNLNMTELVDKQLKINICEDDVKNEEPEVVVSNVLPTSYRKSIIRVDMSNPNALRVLTQMSKGMQSRSNLSMQDAKNILHYKHRTHKNVVSYKNHAKKKDEPMCILDQLAAEEAQDLKNIRMNQEMLKKQQSTHTNSDNANNNTNSKRNNTNTLDNPKYTGNRLLPRTRNTLRFGAETPSGITMNRYVHRYRRTGQIFSVRAKWLEEHKTGYEKIRPAFLSEEEKKKQQQQEQRRKAHKL